MRVLTEDELSEFDRRILAHESGPRGWTVIALSIDQLRSIRSRGLVEGIDAWVDQMPIEAVFMKAYFEEKYVEFFFQDPNEAFEFRIAFT